MSVCVCLCQVKSRLQVRLQELEPIPEMLRSTELQLQEATEKLHCHEARNKESSSLMEELTTKVCTQARHVCSVYFLIDILYKDM